MQRILFGLGLIALAAGVHAAPTLKEAIDGAWAKHPVAQSSAARRDQHGANRDAAGSWLAAPPRATVRQHTDRWNEGKGARELEAELDFPLALPAAREARIALAERESLQYDAATLIEKWRLAGQVREAWWAARLAANELALAQHEVEEAGELAEEIDRRLKAGDVARIDWNHAQAAMRLAELDAAQAKSKAFRANRAFFNLTGLKSLPEGAESQSAARTPADLRIRRDSTIGTDSPIGTDSHIQLAALTRDVETFKARLDEARANRRDPPEVSVGTRRERSAHGEPDAGSLMLRLTIPFASGARNQPKIAGANADLIEAQARLQLEREKIAAEVVASEEELDQSRVQVDIARARLALTNDSHVLLEKAYKLGQIELVARLRAEAERFDAQLALSRAELEYGRAISRLNQALGILP